jgi:hypothetical protein
MVPLIKGYKEKKNKVRKRWGGDEGSGIIH